MGANNTPLRSNFLHLSSSHDPYHPLYILKVTPKTATVHFKSNTSTKSKNGSLTCSINDISAHGHRKRISIVYLTVNSLLPRIDEAHPLIQDLGLHTLATNETKLDDSTDDALISIDGYSNTRCDRNRKGGGVALYIKDMNAALEVDGSLISDGKSIAQSINDYFCSIGNALTDKAPETPIPLLEFEYSIKPQDLPSEFKAVNMCQRKF